MNVIVAVIKEVIKIFFEEIKKVGVVGVILGMLLILGVIALLHFW